MHQMIIDSIRVSLTNYQRVVFLRVKDSTQLLPIWIGPSEADSIALKLQDVDVPRPLTHDLLRTVISTLGATVTRVVVSDLNNDTFYAKIVLQYNGNNMEVDARPSDAIALAVRTDAPIFADDSVVERAAIQIDEETGKPIIPTDEESGGRARPMREEELKNLSAYTDFIETLNLAGLGGEEKLPPESAAPGTS